MPVELGEFLRAQSKVILRHWEEAVRQIPRARPLPTPVLLEHIRDLITRLAETAGDLAHGGRRRMAHREPVLHALQRLDVGFDLADVVREYSSLRTIVRRVADARGVHLSRQDEEFVDVAIDEAIIEAVTTYAASRQKLIDALERVSALSLRNPDLEGILSQLLNVFVEIMAPADTAAILLLEGDRLRVRASAGLAAKMRRQYSVVLGEGFAGRIAAERRPLMLRLDEDADAIRSDALGTSGLRTLFGVPMIIGDELVGLMHVGSRTASEFSEEQQALIQAIANRATAVVVQVQVATGHQSSNVIARALAAATTLDEGVARLLKAIGSAYQWELGAYWRVDDQDESLQLQATWDTGWAGADAFHSAGREMTFARGIGLPGRAWSSGAVEWIADVASDANFPRLGLARVAGLRSGLAFPVSGGGRVLGVLEFFSRDERAWTEEGVETTAAIARQLPEFMDRVAALETVRRSEALKTAMVDVALDCVVSMGADGRITGWNPAAERTFGYSAAEAIGRPLAEVIVPPALREAHRAGLARYLATGESRVLNRRLELTGVRRDGTEFPVELAITRVTSDGPPMFTGYLRDISERRRAEQDREFVAAVGKALGDSLDYEETLARAARLAVPYLADWCLVDVLGENGIIRRAYGLHKDPAKTPLLEEFCSRYPPTLESSQPTAVAIRTGKSQLVPMVDRELAPATKDARDAQLTHDLGARSMIVAPMWAGDRVIGSIGLVSEVPDHYGMRELQVAEELARRTGVALQNAGLYREAQNATRVREHVLAVVSHDLKNPLGGIVAAAALLLRRMDAASRKQVEVILRAADRMERLIGDLVDMASIDAGRLSIVRADHDLETLASDAVDMHQAVAAAKGVKVTCEFRLGGARAQCDRDRVEQVFANLLTNAIKFCDSGDSIAVRGERIGGFARFAISDSCQGIAPDDVPRVFDPYWSTRRAGKGGTGLGLFISRGIVEAHGGRIGVDSTVGKGSTFWFTVPLTA
jgi:PAS domain S-box-containing protein